MTVQINEIQDCQVKASYSADPEVVKDKRKDALELVKKSVPKMSGYRNGKAPDLVYKNKFKKQIEELVKKELVSMAYDEVLFETKMKPLGYPKVLSSELFDASFFCSLLFLKKPDFKLGQYKDFEIPKPHAFQTVNDLFMKSLQDVREKYAQVFPYSETDCIQAGDSITIDMSCKIDGEVIDKFTKQGVFYSTLESDLALLVPEFNKQIYGMKIDEERTFSVKFTEALGELSDKVAEFNIKMHIGTKKKLPIVDDELAKMEGFENKKALGDSLMGKATTQYRNQQTALLQNQVVTRLLSTHEIEVPKWLLESEVKNIAQQNNIVVEQLKEAEVDKLIEVAENRIKLSLILDSIREAEPETVFSNEELLNGLKNNLIKSGENAEEIIKNATKNGSLYGILASLKDDVTIQWILDHSKIIE